MPTLTTTATPMANGQNAVAGVGKTYRFTVGGTWALDDTWLINLVDNQTALSIPVGVGNLTGQEVVFLKTFRRKMNVLYGTNLAFSGLDLPTQFNDTDNIAGSGFIDFANEQALVEDLKSIAVYQGKLALFSRNSIVIENVDADPANYSLNQLLENIGTVAGRSVRSIGDLDVLFLHDSGVRSLRVRDASNNATQIDLGSPIDTLVQAALATANTEQICSCVEPRTNRYWLAINDTIFVFSYFASADIIAWTKYACTYKPYEPIVT